MASWRSFWRLTRLERLLLLRAMLLLPLTSLALRLVGFRSLQALLVRRLPAAPEFSREPAVERAALTARMVRAAARRDPGRPNCLKQSVVLWWLLRRQGIPAELRIGVRKTGQVLEAHAWVEHEGAPLHEEEDLHEHYAPFEGPLAAASPGTGTQPR